MLTGRSHQTRISGYTVETDLLMQSVGMCSLMAEIKLGITLNAIKNDNLASFGKTASTQCDSPNIN
jgi:hypothetical protein